jgi:hypothetical protein
MWHATCPSNSQTVHTWGNAMKRALIGSIVMLTLVGCSDDTGVEGIVLETPSSLVGTSLNGAILLTWSDNAYLNAPAGTFLEYRVYSTSYSIDTDPPLCAEDWGFEGSTIAPEFLVSALENGIPRCYVAVSVSVDGLESNFPQPWGDTPRPDARNVIIWAYQANQALSGFRFWDDVNGNGLVDPLELGTVGDGNRTDIDFWVDRDGNGDFWLVPERTGTTVAVYGTTPIGDLTSIDLAPEAGYSDLAITALPMWGYVFQMDEGDINPRFGGLRVTHVGRDFMIFDWSYQTDPGNPELSVHGGRAVADETGITVSR